MDQPSDIADTRAADSGKNMERARESVERANVSAETTRPKFLYRELRMLARRQLAGRGGAGTDHTLCTTALVHEAFLRLAAQQDISFENRSHFLGYVARAMRSVVVDEARRRQTDRHGGGWMHVQWSDDVEEGGTCPEQVIVLDQALEHLAVVDQRLSDIAELRIFGGLGQNECSQALGVSPRTVARLWRRARAMLVSLLEAECRNLTI